MASSNVFPFGGICLALNTANMAQIHSTSTLNRHLNTAGLNVRGCKTDDSKKTIIKDMIMHDLHILGISETHISETGLHTFIQSLVILCHFCCGVSSSGSISVTMFTAVFIMF